MPLQPTLPAPPTPAAKSGRQAPAAAHAPAAAQNGALEAWLCALLTALLFRLEPIAHLFPNAANHLAAGHPAANGQKLDAQTRRIIRAANRLRAWIGWILRFDPNRGMARRFARLAPPPPHPHRPRATVPGLKPRNIRS